LGTFACSSSSSSGTDVAYEDSYAADYYYPTDVAYSGVYAAGWSAAGYGLYAVTPTQSHDGGGSVVDAATSSVDAASTHMVDAATGVPPSGTGVHGAVGEIIRNLALGGNVCAGQVTVTRPLGASVCGQSGSGLNITFNGCQLPGGGTVDGTVNVQLNRTASNSACDGTTMVGLGYMSTLTNLTYTGTSGAKIMIPSQTDTATINFAFGSAPTTITLTSTGEIERMDTNGTLTSDRSYTGTRTISSISLASQSYAAGGTINVTDKTDGGTGTLTGSGLQRDANCCKPVGGTLSVSRTGGKHDGTHNWTFDATCGSAKLDGNMVTLPACI
jgi:hypothetical protein